MQPPQRLLLLVSCLFCFSHVSHAQTKGKIHYLSQSWEETEKKNAHYFKSTFPVNDSIEFVQVFYINGAVKMKGHYSTASQPVKEGKFIYFYKNGQVESEGFYRHGNKVGTWSRYEKDGTKRPDRFYTGETHEEIMTRQYENIFKL